MHEGGRRDTTIGAMLCENDHEWLATMTPPDPDDGLVRPIRSDRVLPRLWPAHAGDAEGDDLLTSLR